MLIKPLHHKALIIFAVAIALFSRFTLSILEIPHYKIYNYRMLPDCMDALGLGAFLAYLKLNQTERLVVFLKKSVIPAIAAVIFLIGAFFFKHTGLLSEVALRFLVSVSSFFLIGNSLWHVKNRFGRLLENSILQYLGKISYGLYLYHLILSSLLSSWFRFFWDSIQSSVPEIIKYNSYVFSFPFYLMGTILIASVSYYYNRKTFFAY